MPAGLERQLRGAFGRLPKPSRDATTRARASALSALGPSPRWRPRGLLVLAFAITFLVGAGAAALAATGKLHVDLGVRPKPAPAVPTRLSVPPGSQGLAIVAGGKLWLATRTGLRIQGLPVSAAELSPHALYAVVGIGSSLVALAPGNRRPWVHETGGPVVAASWSPDGLKIAYVVARKRGDELHLIEGDGSPDRLLARGVSPVKPSWRPGSLGVAYADARGRAAIFDLATGSSRTFDTRRCGGPARGLAYARRARELAVTTAHGLAIVERWSLRPRCARYDVSASPSALGWIRPNQLLVVVNRPRDSSLVRFGTDLNEIGAAFTSRTVDAVAVDPSGSSVAVAVWSRNVLELGLVPKPRLGAKLRFERPWLRIAGPARGVSISWR
jgi:hypothetical protein